MILGIGTDIVDIRRIEKLYLRFGNKFEHRVFSAVELAHADRRGKAGTKARAAILAKRFAAKEACAKALGTGIGKISFHEIVVSRNAEGAPQIVLSGFAASYLKGRTPEGMAAAIHVSLADDYPVAQAFVVISVFPA